MAADPRPAVGRDATPTPPDVGQTSLGAVLRLQTDPVIQGARWVHCLGSPRLRRSLEGAGMAVWPAVPGLATEALDLVPVQAVVLEEAALESGPWSGALGDVAPELAQQIAGVIERAGQLNAPVYWLSTTPEREDEGAGQDKSDRILVDLARVLVVAPRTPLFVGDPEGAPPSRLVSLLREHVGAELQKAE